MWHHYYKLESFILGFEDESFAFLAAHSVAM